MAGRHVERNVAWVFLNVVLPLGLAGLTYGIAKISKDGATVDDLLAMCFANGDLLMVSAVMLIAVLYEIWDFREASSDNSANIFLSQSAPRFSNHFDHDRGFLLLTLARPRRDLRRNKTRRIFDRQ